MTSDNRARYEESESPRPAADAAGGDEPAATEGPAVEQSAADPEQLRAEAEGLREQLLRVAAEMENVRRRAERDVENAHRYGIERFAREVIAVRDSLEMGLAAAAEAGAEEAVTTLTEGLRATLKQLDQSLEKFGISELDPAGERFDPELHEAMATLATRDTSPGDVMQVVQKGYLIHDRLLRPARVIVAREAED